MVDGPVDPKCGLYGIGILASPDKHAQGFFFLSDDPEKKYTGKHELIIPAKILKAVKAINDGKVVKRPLHDGEDIFRGWLSCGHPECQRSVTYERKEKTLKSGEAKVYHLYRCSNSRKIHARKEYIPEEKIWDQLEPAVEALSIPEEFAKDISNALNETRAKQQAAIRKQMEGFKLELKKLEGREDEVYADLKRGVLDDVGYQRQIKRVREDRDHYASEIERLTLMINDEAMISVQRVFELAIDAKSKWKGMNREERLEYLKLVCSRLFVKTRGMTGFVRIELLTLNFNERSRSCPSGSLSPVLPESRFFRF